MTRADRIFRQPSLDGSNPTTLAAALRGLDVDLGSIFETINRISLGEPADGEKLTNFDAAYLVYISNVTPNLQDLLQHKLGRIPVGLILVELPIPIDGTSQSGQVYFAPTAPTDTEITLRCSVATKRCCVILF